uniref:Uncharacterized protein n=1 Tax=Rhizophora mucronata TaxID=61149 RepID=A0A2P2N6G8_RHIMU
MHFCWFHCAWCTFVWLCMFHVVGVLKAQKPWKTVNQCPMMQLVLDLVGII